MFKGLPYGRGAAVGILSLVVPYVVVLAASLTVLSQRAADAGTNVFFMLVGFGPGDRIVDIFVTGSTISGLGNVRPEEYPDVQAELERTLDVLTSTPEALLLGVYVLFPLLLVLGGRYLARSFAVEDDLLAHAVAPIALLAGTLPVAVVLTAAFQVVQPGTRIVVVGVVLPLLFGLAGAMTVYGFRHVNWFPSKAYGWAAGILGVLLTGLLYPIPSGAGISVDPIQQFILGLHGYVATVSLGTGLSPITGAFGAPSGATQLTSFGLGGGLGFLLVLVTFGLVVLAGFARVYRNDRRILPGLEAARVGASIVLGFLPLVALVGIVMPLLLVVAGGPLGIGSILLGTSPNVSAYTSLLLVGGTLVPLALGGAGGYVAAWYQQRQQPPAPPQGAPPQGQPQQPPQQPGGPRQ